MNVIYLPAEEASLSARASSGRLSLDRDSLTIEGDTEVRVPLASVREVAFARSQLGQCVRLDHEGGRLWIGAYWLDLWGYFAILNRRANRLLAQRIRQLIS